MRKTPRCRAPGCDRLASVCRNRKCPQHKCAALYPAHRETRWAIATAQAAPPLPPMERLMLRVWLEHMGGAEALTQSLRP